MKLLILAILFAATTSVAIAQGSTHYEYSFDKHEQSPKLFIRSISFIWSELNKNFSYTADYGAEKTNYKRKVTFTILFFNKDHSVLDHLSNGPTIKKSTGSTWSTSIELPYKPTDAVLQVAVNDTVVFNKPLDLPAHEQKY